MDIRPDDILRGPDLEGATEKKPMKGTIKSVKFLEPEDLGFESRDGKGRWELEVKLPDKLLYRWMPNKTALKALVAAFGKSSNGWPGKGLLLWSVEKDVFGETKDVIFAKAE